MQEVLERRFRRGKEEGDLPDLLIVDGGKGHLNIAKKVLESLDVVTVDLIGVAKEMGRHDKGMTSEQIFLLQQKDPITFKKNSHCSSFCKISAMKPTALLSLFIGP